MKILLYSIYKGIFLEEALYDGFSDLIGKNNVFFYKPEDYRIEDTQINILDCKNVYGNEVLEEIDNFDYILFFNSAFLDKYFYAVLNKKSNVRKIFIDGIDDFFIRRIYKHPEISYYFKRELYKWPIKKLKKLEWMLRYYNELNRTPGTAGKKKHWLSYWNLPIGLSHQKKFNLLPMPLTVANPVKYKIKKARSYEVSFVGHNNNPERKMYVKMLYEYLTKNKIKDFISTKIVDKERYIEIIKHSKSGLSTRGTGYDTWRYWEIPCYGTALLAQRTPINIPNNFVEGESALFFKNFDELKQKFEKYVIKSNEWLEIAKNGQKHFFKYHTCKKRSEYLLKKVKD
jgi:hypothetical protein